jgi:hypothetical protein
LGGVVEIDEDAGAFAFLGLENSLEQAGEIEGGECFGDGKVLVGHWVILCEKKANANARGGGGPRGWCGQGVGGMIDPCPFLIVIAPTTLIF